MAGHSSVWVAALAVALASLLARRPGSARRLELLGHGRGAVPVVGRPTWWRVAGRVRGWATRADMIAGRRAALVFVDALAAELAVGRPPVVALQRAADDCGDPGVQRVGRAARLGGDVVDGLRGLAPRPGWGALSGVAACWSVGVGSGAGLVDGLRRVASVVRAEDDVTREVAATLAAPRATARMLALLPLVGLGLGGLLGARPWQILVGTPYGLACLALGLLLDAAGVYWVERMARSAEPAHPQP